jgi:hypothetical protein
MSPRMLRVIRASTPGSSSRCQIRAESSSPAAVRQPSSALEERISQARWRAEYRGDSPTTAASWLELEYLAPRRRTEGGKV